MLKKLLLIINPVAGKKRMKNYLLDVIQIFGRGGYSTTVFVTARRGEATEAILKAKDFDLVVCCGGDGTLNEAICGIMKYKSNTPLGYIPCGSTNDFANSMGLPLDIRKCAEAIAMGAPTPLDIGKFNDKYFSYVASFGAFTATSYSVSQDVKNFWGHAAYIFEGIKDLSSVKPYHMKLIADDQEFEGDYVFGAIANTKSFGGIIKLKDELVSLNDGLFEVLLIKMPKNILDLNAIITSLTTSKFDNKNFEFIKASNITVIPADPIPWSLDGEYVHPDAEIKIANLHGAVDFYR